jgi:hypothetical protein
MKITIEMDNDTGIATTKGDPGLTPRNVASAICMMAGSILYIIKEIAGDDKEEAAEGLRRLYRHMMRQIGVEPTTIQ